MQVVVELGRDKPIRQTGSSEELVLGRVGGCENVLLVKSHLFLAVLHGLSIRGGRNSCHGLVARGRGPGTPGIDRRGEIFDLPLARFSPNREKLLPRDQAAASDGTIRRDGESDTLSTGPWPGLGVLHAALARLHSATVGCQAWLIDLAGQHVSISERVNPVGRGSEETPEAVAGGRGEGGRGTTCAGVTGRMHETPVEGVNVTLDRHRERVTVVIAGLVRSCVVSLVCRVAGVWSGCGWGVVGVVWSASFVVWCVVSCDYRKDVDDKFGVLSDLTVVSRGKKQTGKCL